MNISYTNELHAKYKDRTVASAEAILPLVFAQAAPQSVVDVGCGHGLWLDRCRSLGAGQVAGIDGSYIDPAQMAIPADCFHTMDLNHPVLVGKKFDLAISLEVVEHLKPGATPAFLDLLASLSDHILFSAAIPGQPGDVHINSRWPAFWIQEFAKRGFVALDFIRPRIWHDESVALCYRQNILYFVAENEYKADAGLHSLPRANCLHLVDEDTLQFLMGTKESLRRCWRNWWGSFRPAGQRRQAN